MLSLTFEFWKKITIYLMLGNALVFILVYYYVLCRYMKEVAASSEKDDKGSQNVTESLSAEKDGMSKTVRFLSCNLPLAILF